MVRISPSNAGNVGLIPGWGTKIPYAKGQLSYKLQLQTPTCGKDSLCAARKTQHSQKKKMKKKKKKKSWLSHPNFSSSNSPAQKQLTGAIKSEDGPGGCMSTSHRGEPQD